MRPTVIALLTQFVSLLAIADPRVTLIAGPPALDKPFGVDIAPNGTLYVIDFTGRLASIAPDGSLTSEPTRNSESNPIGTLIKKTQCQE